MKELDIHDYASQLKDVCEHCSRYLSCKDHNKLCFTKKFVFAVAKSEYKRRCKKGLINESS